MRLGHIRFSARKALINTCSCSQIASFVFKDAGKELSFCGPRIIVLWAKNYRSAGREFETPDLHEAPIKFVI